MDSTVVGDLGEGVDSLLHQEDTVKKIVSASNRPVSYFSILYLYINCGKE